LKIVGGQLYRYALPLARPLNLRGREVWVRAGVLVSLRSDHGRVGWGDAAPLPAYSSERIADVEKELAKALRRLPDMEIGSEADARGVASWRVLGASSPSVLCGLETALMGLVQAGGSESSAPTDLAGFRMPVRVNGLLAGPRDRVLQDLRTLVDEGYGTFKLKLGRSSLADDVDITRTVRSLLDKRAALRLDANRAWSLQDAIRFGKEVGAEGIAYLEEPLSHPSGLPAFFEATGISVALDESVRDLAPEELEGRKDVAAVVLKPTLLGGLSRARRWAEKAVELDLTPVVSSSFESGVGILGLARLASSFRRPEVAVGIDTYRWLAQDVITPRLRFERGALEPRPGAGRLYGINFALLHEIQHA